MEPCAPGTEDDPPIMYSTLNKQENEQERLLSQKAFLRNGKYDNVFELSYQNGAAKWYCKACECPVMGRVFQHESGRRHTINLSKHNMEKFQKAPSPEEPVQVEVAPGEPLPPGFEDIGRVSQIQERLDGFKVGPLVALEYLLELQDDDSSKEPFYLCILCDKKGDPRTVLTHLASYNHISQYLQKHFPTCWRALAPYNTKQYRRNWQTTLQKIAEGIEKKFGRLKPYPIDKDKFEKDRMHFLQIVGKGRHFTETTGYTFEELVVHEELTKSHEEEKSYESTSANNWGHVSTIQKPFKKRSPSPPVVGIPKKNKGNALTNPRKAQEPAYTVPAKQQLGLNNPPMRPQQTPGGDSSSSGLQQAGQSVVKTSPPRQQSRRRSLSSVSSLSDNSDCSDDDRDKRSRDRFPYNRSRPHYDRGKPLPYGRRRSPSPRHRSPYRRRSPSLKRRFSPKYRSKSPVSRRSVSPSTEKEREKTQKLDEFKKLARAIETDMQKTLKQHEKNPEKHPQYNDEWKKFWNRRYKELKSEGVDVQKHDFKPEWIQFWNKRMVELHNEELKTKKEALKKRLGLSDEIAPIRFRIGGPPLSLPDKIGLAKNPIKPVPMAAQPDQDNEVIIIDDKDEDGAKNWKDKSKGGLSRTKSNNRSVSPNRDRSPPGRSRTKQYSRSQKRSISRDLSPFSDSFKMSRLSKRSTSRDRLPSRRSRSRSKSPEKTSTKRSLSGDRNLSRLKNPSPITANSSASRFKGRHRDSRDRSLSRNRSRSRSRGASPYTRRSKDRRSPSRERSWEKRDADKKFIRESSFERDLRAKERIRTVADLPWESREMLPGRVYRNPYLPPPVMRDVTRKPVDLVGGSKLPLENDEDDSEVNVVDVLRLLTALEERLGSLGPKVIDLLAQALALEKNEANSSESLLDNDINCVLFETVKEKLKGQMFAGLVDVVQERAFKRAIKKIASLLHMAGQRKKQRSKVIPKATPVTVPGLGKVDKAAIARQIANALVAQGKTDVSQSDLETLINAVVGMAEVSKTSNKPITTANFLQQLGADKDKPAAAATARKSDLIDLEKLTEPLTPSPGKNSINNMENLSDSDLQMLLQNFKDLSTEEQQNLINYLKKLEYQEPERVEKLRKFVNLETGFKENDDEDVDKKIEQKKGRESPFSNRSGALNPDNDLIDIDSDEEIEKDEPNDAKDDDKDKSDKRVHVDSEDEYTFEDVVKTVSKNVKDKEMEHNKKVLEETLKYDKASSSSDINLTNAKDLISNLMANINKTNSNHSSNVDLLGLGPTARNPNLNPNLPANVADVDLTKLSDINMSNLASIVNNFKNMPANPATESNKLDFQPPSTVKSANKLNIDLALLKPAPLEEVKPMRQQPFDRGMMRFDPPDGPRRPMENQRFDRFNADRFVPDRFAPGDMMDRFSGGYPQGNPDRFGGGPSLNVDKFGNFGGPERNMAGRMDKAPPPMNRFPPSGGPRMMQNVGMGGKFRGGAGPNMDSRGIRQGGPQFPNDMLPRNPRGFLG